jgi:hypothetical protein
MATRTEVKAATFAKITSMTFATPVQGQSTWVTASQKLKLWGEVDVTLRPAVFLVSHSEEDEYRGLGLYRRRLRLAAWCYTRCSETDIGDTQLDTIMDSFEATFGQAAVDNFSTNECTLGGLVYFVRIDGKVFRDPGDLDNDAMLIVPLLVEMPWCKFGSSFKVHTLNLVQHTHLAKSEKTFIILFDATDVKLLPSPMEANEVKEIVCGALGFDFGPQPELVPCFDIGEMKRRNSAKL